jgi:hypothetical protein
MEMDRGLGPCARPGWLDGLGRKVFCRHVWDSGLLSVLLDAGLRPG